MRTHLVLPLLAVLLPTLAPAQAVGTVVVRGRPQVLLADKDRSHAQSLVAALRSQNIDVTVVEPAEIPKDIAGLQKYDGVVLSNVSSLKLTSFVQRSFHFGKEPSIANSHGYLIGQRAEQIGVTPVQTANSILLHIQDTDHLPFHAKRNGDGHFSIGIR